MNQNPRKTDKSKVEKNFYKLLDNINFGNDCKSNIGNCKLELMFDGLDEISYIKKFTNIMQDNRYREFFSLDLLYKQVEAEYDKKRKKLDEENPFYFATLENLDRKKERDLEDPIVSQIYGKYDIERIFCYHVLTDTDSSPLQLIIVSDPSSSYPECDVTDILFEIFCNTEIRDRFDKSDEFWMRFGVRCPQNQKVLGLYEVEHIDDPCYVTLAANPKEYFEYFKSDKVNKKHKGIKKGSIGMKYENYAERIKPLFDFKNYKKPKADMKEVVCISVKQGEMTTHKITKTKFSQLNYKKFYFPNGILSLSFGHLSLNELDEYKRNKGQRIEKYFWTEKEKLLELEKKALKACPRLDFLNDILLQVPKIVCVDCTKFDKNAKFLYKERRQIHILDFILSAGWR